MRTVPSSDQGIVGAPSYIVTSRITNYGIVVGIAGKIAKGGSPNDCVPGGYSGRAI